MIGERIIQTTDVTKDYGSFRAVDRLNCRERAERITGFLGRNGAGKSSTIKMLLGMTRPSSGSGTVLGYRIDDPKQSIKIRRRIAYVGEDKGPYGSAGAEGDVTEYATALAKTLDEMKPKGLNYKFSAYRGENHNSVRLVFFPPRLHWVYRK